MGMMSSVRKSGVVFSKTFRETIDDVSRARKQRARTASINRDFNAGARQDYYNAAANAREMRKQAKRSMKNAKRDYNLMKKNSRDIARQVRRELPYLRPMYQYGISKMKSLKTLPSRIDAKVTNFALNMPRKVRQFTASLTTKAIHAVGNLWVKGYNNIRNAVQQRQERIESEVEAESAPSLADAVAEAKGEIVSQEERTVAYGDILDEQAYNSRVHSDLTSAAIYPFDNNGRSVDYTPDDTANEKFREFGDSAQFSESEIKALEENSRIALQRCLRGERLGYDGMNLVPVFEDRDSGIIFSCEGTNMEPAHASVDELKSQLEASLSGFGVSSYLCDKIAQAYAPVIEKNTLAINPLMSPDINENQYVSELLDVQEKLCDAVMQDEKASNADVASVRVVSDYVLYQHLIDDAPHFNTVGLDSYDNDSINRMLENALSQGDAMVLNHQKDEAAAVNVGPNVSVDYAKQFRAACRVKGIYEDVADRVYNHFNEYSSDAVRVSAVDYINQSMPDMSGIRSFDEAYDAKQVSEHAKQRDLGIGGEILDNMESQNAFEYEYE